MQNFLNFKTLSDYARIIELTPIFKQHKELSPKSYRINLQIIH